MAGTHSSIFDPNNPHPNGMTRGGLDRYMGPPASEYSHLPAAVENADGSDAPEELDCAGKDADEAVCEIAKAEEQERKQDGTT